MEFRHIGVLGAGNIGSSVVTDLILHGISAVVVDLSDEIRAFIKENEPKLKAKPE